MKRGGLFDRKVRVAVVVGVGVVVLGMTSPVAAKDPLAPSRTCRKTVAGEMAKLGKLINGLIAKCHKTQLKAGLARTNCNVIGTTEFDPIAKYAGYKTKAQAKIASKCLSPDSDPELGNFQAGDPFARLLPELEKDTAKIAVASIGDDTVLAADKATAKCVNTIAKWHGKLYYDVLKNSNKAQKLTDKTATTFGRISEANVDAASATQTGAAAAIGTDCSGVSGIDSCTNSGSCLDGTRTQAQLLTREVYHGNNTCEPLIGTRVVQITINTPENLAGMKVDLDYPQYQTGLVGTEQSLLVADAVGLTHEDPGMFKVVNDRETDMSIVVGATNAFIQNGDKVTITFDACAAKERNMCNRSQQVTDCAIPTPPFNANPTVCTFPGPLDAYPEGIITGIPGGCCPGDNACFPQALTTVCSVTDPVRANGTNVSGVTCSVAISGT